MDKESRMIIKEGVKLYGLRFLPKAIFSFYKGYMIGVIEGIRLRRKEAKYVARH